MNSIEKIKSDIRLVQKRHIYYELDESGRIKRRPAWLGDWVAFLYDGLMKNNVFPKKFGSNWEYHDLVLKDMLATHKNEKILELGTGSGIAAQWLAPNNYYVGVDVSAGLLKRAVKKFSTAGFKNSEFYIVDVNELPFENESFDVCLCILTMNFFDDLKTVADEIHRVLKSGGQFYGCVPVTERLKSGSKIQGTLRGERELHDIFTECNFQCVPLSVQNGSIYYFSACKNKQLF